MTHECLVLWVHANDLLADASFDSSNAAKHLFLDAKLSLARYTLAPICAELTHQTYSKSGAFDENMMEG
jgi:hypothetical protein